MASNPRPARVVVRGGARGLLQTITAGRHAFLADEPVGSGGEDRGPDPYDLLLASLGACTSMTLRMYADRKGWPLEGVEVALSHARVHADDCTDCGDATGQIDRIDRRIRLAGPLDERQRARLLEIADRCPVHRTLTGTIVIVTREASESTAG